MFTEYVDTNNSIVFFKTNFTVCPVNALFWEMDKFRVAFVWLYLNQSYHERASLE